MPKQKATCTLADLNAEEKQKVTKLVQQLLRLGQEHEQLNTSYQTLVHKHADLQRQHEEEVMKESKQLEHCKEKYAKALQLLKDYQNCILLTMQNSQNDAWNADQMYQSQVQGYKLEIARLQALVESQHAAMASLKSRAAQFSALEEKYKLSEAAHREAIRTASNEQRSLRLQLQEAEHQYKSTQEELKMENRKRTQAEAMAARFQQECELPRMVVAAASTTATATTAQQASLSPAKTTVAASVDSSAVSMHDDTPKVASTSVHQNSPPTQASMPSVPQPPVHILAPIPPILHEHNTVVHTENDSNSTESPTSAVVPPLTEQPSSASLAQNPTHLNVNHDNVVRPTERAQPIERPKVIYQEEIQQEIEALRKQLSQLQSNGHGALTGTSTMEDLQLSYDSQASNSMSQSSRPVNHSSQPQRQTHAKATLLDRKTVANVKPQAVARTTNHQPQHNQIYRTARDVSRRRRPDSMFIDAVSALVDPGYYEDSLFSLVESLDLDS